MKKNLLATNSLAQRNFERRGFLKLAGFSIFGSVLLSACGGDDPEPGPGVKPEPEPEPEADKTLAFFGDSLTQGAGGSASYATLVGKALDNRAILVDAIGGQNSSQIATRQGGLPLTISVEGNAFKGTDEVKITKISNEFLSTAATVNQQSRKATVAGVKCTIFRVGQTNPRVETYTIKPDAASTTAIPADSVATLDNATKGKTATQILWFGRNNVGTPTMVTDVQNDLEKAVETIAEPKRFVVLGVLAALLEIKTTSLFKTITELNSQLETKYGSQFVPMLAPTDAELAAISYTPTDQDKIEIENGVFPMGLRADRTHLNDKGYQIIANRVTAKLKELKY